MARLIVTMTRALPYPFPPVDIHETVGSAAITEIIQLGETSALGELSAEAGESVVEVAADEPCWYRIGSDPVAAVGEGRWLPANGARRHWIAEGEGVAAIADSDPPTEAP